jgi:hypothetical protein
MMLYTRDYTIRVRDAPQVLRRTPQVNRFVSDRQNSITIDRTYRYTRNNVEVKGI